MVTQPSRLPATILSRCQRIRIRAPQRAQALTWLEATRGKADWGGVLDVLGNAPLLAGDCDPEAVVQINREVQQALADATAGKLDPAATAERWARSEVALKSEPALRLRCFENWLTECVAGKFATDGFLTEVRAVPCSQRPLSVLNIRRVFELLDGVREMKSELDVPINRGLALEALLRCLQPVDGRSLRNTG